MNAIYYAHIMSAFHFGVRWLHRTSSRIVVGRLCVVFWELLSIPQPLYYQCKRVRHQNSICQTCLLQSCIRYQWRNREVLLNMQRKSRRKGVRSWKTEISLSPSKALLRPHFRYLLCCKLTNQKIHYTNVPGTLRRHLWRKHRGNPFIFLHESCNTLNPPFQLPILNSNLRRTLISTEAPSSGLVKVLFL